MEQPLFAPGDRVVCVDSKGIDHFITEGKCYTVVSVKREPCCGMITISIGIEFGAYSICTCGHKEVNNHHVRQTRFVPVDFDRYAEETFHQSLKGKPVNA